MSDAITAIATISATIIIVVGTGLLLGSSHRVPLKAHRPHSLWDNIRLKAARTHHGSIVDAVGLLLTSPDHIAFGRRGRDNLPAPTRGVWSPLP